MVKDGKSELDSTISLYRLRNWRSLEIGNSGKLPWKISRINKLYCIATEMKLCKLREISVDIVELIM